MARLLSTASVLALMIACGDSDPELDAGTDAGVCMPFVWTDTTAADREACSFRQGDDVATTLGIDRNAARRIPITHVIVRMQENRSFDHYFGQLPQRGHPDVDGLPEGFSNPDGLGGTVEAFPLDSTCLEADPPHQWEAMNLNWGGGAMDGFVVNAAVEGSDGHYAMGYYDEEDLPYYYWLAKTFAISDRYFSSSLGGTWSNRNFLYTGAAHGVKNTFDAVISDAPTVFDALDDAGVSWGVYVDGRPRQDTLGWREDTPGVHPVADLIQGLADGTMPEVVFVDTPPFGANDEHPPLDIQAGEQWTRMIIEAAMASPLWERLAIILTMDTAGGLLEHVPPPEACLPLDTPSEADFTRLGLRVPFVMVSPWAKPGFVSHDMHSHTSVLRFIELLHDVPALTHRDATSDALLDMFDFDCDPDLLAPPPAPEAGMGGC